MDYRGNMSGQHRRTKINHSVIAGPELTEIQEQVMRTRKNLNKMDVEELNIWLEICRANILYWKNRRSLKKQWEESVENAEKEIKKRKNQC